MVAIKKIKPLLIVLACVIIFAFVANMMLATVLDTGLVNLGVNMTATPISTFSMLGIAVAAILLILLFMAKNE